MSFRWVTILASLAGLASGAAHAIGFVRADSNAALGSFLNFPVVIQLGADESLAAPCVAADVMQGEQRIAPSNVRIVVEPGAVPEERIVRITTRVAIDEPVVSITATLGCINKVERRFTVFADPPVVVLVAAAPPPPPEPSPRAEPAAAAPSAASAPEAPRVPAAESPAARPAPPPPRRVVASRPSSPARPSPGTAVAGDGKSRAPTPAPVRVAAATASAPLARLKLDPLEPIARSAAAASAAVQEAQLRVAALAASAALAERAASVAQANADVAADRLRAVEQALATVRADAQRDRDQLTQLRSQMARDDALRTLTPWLIAALALLAALAVWLALRLRRLQRTQQAQWWAAAQAASRAPPLNPPTLQPMTLPPQMVPTPSAPRRSVAVPQQAQGPATRPSGFGGGSTMFSDSSLPQPPRDVSIEELIDLEQQAEFFVVLGQDDAAIDLLMGHIRGSGGTSPLPYLKLLEIYRRLGDRESYERTRARFNHRFNAYAPDWDVDLQQGRSLDGYPAIMQRIQRCWRSPIDAMTELESLMFRRDAGELFELPAYREVLFLYSMARDLLDHQGGPATAVDVLLPIGEANFETTTAHPHLYTLSTLAPLSELADGGRVGESPITVLSAAFKPTAAPPAAAAAVDLDLSQPAPAGAWPGEPGRGGESDQRSDFLDLPPEPPRPRR